MSMNLNCDKLDLIQIDTTDSYMIYSNGEGGNKGICYRLEQYYHHMLDARIRYFKRVITNEAELAKEIKNAKEYHKYLLEQLEWVRGLRRVEWWVM